jgi:anti-sigma regulatory factor (Ser/Thr protein kinase)
VQSRRRSRSSWSVGAAKIERLRAELGADAAQVTFADMSVVGTNPARIIPAWREFVSARAASGSWLRGIGEPIWAERTAAELAYEEATLSVVRALVGTRAAAAGLGDLRVGDLVIAVNELATNSVRHAGGHGVLRVWHDDDALICEVRDGGRIEHPLAGRERAPSGQPGGHGLWLVNQLCDLVQVRSFAHGSAVRLHMRYA